MSKRHEILQRRQREKTRNRIIVISLVTVGALLIGFGFIVPEINHFKAVNATATQAAGSSVIEATPLAINAPINATMLGDPNAPVKVEVFEDFRCSACKNFTETIEPQIIKNYVETGKVFYSYHAFIVIDSYDTTGASQRAANAALCAADQGLFWQYHTTLFANQITEDGYLFSADRLIAMAQNNNLDMTSFTKCLTDNTHGDKVQQDNARAIALKLDHTPSIVIDGVVADFTSFDQLFALIDSAVAGK